MFISGASTIYIVPVEYTVSPQTLIFGTVIIMSSIPSLIPSAIGEIVRQTELCPAGKYKVSGNKL